MTRISLSFLVAILIAALAGCERFESEEERMREQAIGAPSATNEVLPPGVVRISANSQRSIGIEVESAAKRKVRDTLPTIGWLTPKVGHDVVIKAPTTGFIRPPSAERDFTIGTMVQSAAVLGTLDVFLSPQEQAQLATAKEEADTIMNQALVTIELAQGQLERLKSARDSTAGTRLLDLEEILRKARVAYDEGRDRLPYLPEEPYNGIVKLRPVDVTAPISGRILEVHVSPRQLVTAGDPLWTVANWSTLWLRVPVFQTDLPRIAAYEPADLTVPGAHQALVAKRIDLPQAKNTSERTVDLIYEVANLAEQLRPGQAVSVALPLGAESDRVVIACAAVVWDNLGGAWVYVRTGAEEFRRRHVELGQYLGTSVVIERGVIVGDEVVVVGAEALHGQEFKSDLQVEDED